MAAPWVILGRVLRVGFVPGDVEAEEGDQEAQAHPAAPADAHAEEAAEQAEHDAAADAHAEEEAEHAAAAAEPDFTLPVALPPRVAVLAAARSAHPDPTWPDRHPYILAAGPGCLLSRFSAAPFYGARFGLDPPETHASFWYAASARPRAAAGSRSPPCASPTAPRLHARHPEH